jgi:transposase
MSRTQVLTDEMWARIEPLLPALKGPMGKPMRPHRPLVEGSVFRLRTGVASRDLPAEFGPWQTVWKRRARFSKDGTWDEVLLALQAEADAAGGVDWQVSVDSTIARVHQHGAAAARSELRATAHAGGSVELQGIVG